MAVEIKQLTILGSDYKAMIMTIQSDVNVCLEILGVEGVTKVYTVLYHLCTTLMIVYCSIPLITLHVSSVLN